MSVEELGKKLKEVRGYKGLTLKEVGHRTGFSDAYISMLENGKIDKVPQPHTIHKLAVGLNIPLMELMNIAGYKDHEYDSLSAAFGMDVLQRNKSNDWYIKLKNNEDIFYNGYELSRDDKKLMSDLLERVFSIANRKYIYGEKDK